MKNLHFVCLLLFCSASLRLNSLRNCFILLALVLSIGLGRAQNDVEYKACEIWARFLRVIAFETTWPANAPAEKNPTFMVGLFVPDEVVGAFHFLETNKIKSRTVTVKQCHTLVEAQQCHLVFFSASEERKFVKMVDQLKESSVLTASDSSDFGHHGGIITLGPNEKKKADFKINREAADQARLRLSADLLEPK